MLKYVLFVDKCGKKVVIIILKQFIMGLIGQWNHIYQRKHVLVVVHILYRRNPFVRESVALNLKAGSWWKWCSISIYFIQWQWRFPLLSLPRCSKMFSTMLLPNHRDQHSTPSQPHEDLFFFRKVELISTKSHQAVSVLAGTRQTTVAPAKADS